VLPFKKSFAQKNTKRKMKGGEMYRLPRIKCCITNQDNLYVNKIKTHKDFL